MLIDPAYVLFETDHWQLNHHLTSRLPGYLMLGAKAPIDSLADMPDAALAELGGIAGESPADYGDAVAAKVALYQPLWAYAGLPVAFSFDPGVRLGRRRVLAG